jgi:hypothetical protein
MHCSVRPGIFVLAMVGKVSSCCGAPSRCSLHFSKVMCVERSGGQGAANEPISRCWRQPGCHDKASSGVRCCSEFPDLTLRASSALPVTGTVPRLLSRSV